jgi:hypothetical protein
MILDAPNLTEIEIQNTFLFSKVGVEGSGAVRYGAAMYFYQQKLLSPEMLEIYRRCCKFDKEDPIDLARFESIQDIPNSNLGS